MLNFMKLRDYPLDISDFNHDMSNIVDRIYVGPQGELLEHLERFNQQYNTELEVTKQFTLKPGGYDKLKKAYSNFVLRWDMRPRGMESIFNRVDEYRWRGNNMKTDAVTLEDRMIRLRSSGIRWQDNTEDFIHETAKLKDIITDSIEICKTLYPNVDISVKIIPSTLGRMNTNAARTRYNSSGREYLPELADPDLNNPSDYVIAFYIHIKEPEMTVHHLRGDNDINTYAFPCHDIIVASATYLLPLISRNWGRETLRADDASSRNYSYFLEAMYLTPFGDNRHPYIHRSADLYTWNLDQHIGNPSHVCTGNMGPEIRNTLLNSQIEAHITYLVTWLTNYYIPQTNPLNRVHTMRNTGQDRLFNSYMSECGSFDNTADPHECSIGNAISIAIEKHASGDTNTHYSSSSVLWVPGDPEYASRKEDYLASIDTKDLPCHNCMHSDVCHIKTNVFTFLQDEVYTPMEEAYIGMFIEISQYQLYLRPSRSRSPERNYFAEEAILWANYDDPSKFYDILVESNICVQRWCLANGEESYPGWSGERFKMKFDAVMRKADNDRKGLLEHALDDKSEFIWTLDSVSAFVAKKVARKSKVKRESTNEVTSTEPNFYTIEPEIVDILQDEENNTHLTPEERTLQWATTMGGSTNL